MNENDLYRVDLSQRLFIELGTSLRIETPDKKIVLSGKLVGMMVGEFLIIDIFGTKSDKLPFTKDDPVLVKYINFEDIFNFSSKVLRVIHQPGMLVFLQYPEKVESGNIRSHRRVDCFLPIYARIGDLQAQGIAVNISAEGCLCMIDHSGPWKDTTHREIELLFSYGDLETLSIIGEIRTQQIQECKVKLSVRFNEVDPYSQSVLSTLVPALNM